MDHPKCATCKHFAPETDEWDTPEGFGKCLLVEMTCEISEWDAGYENQTLKLGFKEHLAGVMDGSSYAAYLYPHLDFYCPMHSDLMPQLVQRPHTGD